MNASDPLTWTFVALVAAATGLALLAVRGTLSLGVRCGALGLSAVIMAAGYGGLSELMSRAKPVNLEWARASAKTAKVAASHLSENEAIYLWLILDGETEPRAYRLPWDLAMAKQLREAQRQAERRQSEVRMKLPFKNRRADESVNVFHAPPRPAPPPKDPGAS